MPSLDVRMEINMSIYANRATLSLLNMTNEMYRKNIEIRRITKTCAMLMMSGLSKNDISDSIVRCCLESQKSDGGFIGNTDTLWNIKFLEFFPEYKSERSIALNWLLKGNGTEPGYGRSKRDIHRIPVTGLALYLLPEIANNQTLEWLEKTWKSEINSLTYKAAYTIMAFQKNQYIPQDKKLILNAAKWIASQQQQSGGFAPWLDHPVGENVYCTAVSMLALIATKDLTFRNNIIQGYRYLCSSQLKSGIWSYHEIEDGAAWGLLALTVAENYLERLL